jgi:CRISPR system Cascade subunit CasA
MASFVLVEEPWIPCEDLSGRACEVGLREALVRAHELRGIVDASPLVTVALHRLLLAVLHRVFGPKDLATWRDLWTRGHFDAPLVEAYLTQWRHRLDLFDAQRPFYQTPKGGYMKTTKGTKKRPAARVWQPFTQRPATEILAERSNWGVGRDLFEHRPASWQEPLRPAIAARHLVALHAFAPCGLVSRAPEESCSAHAGLLNGVAVALLCGKSLFETLLLNLLCYDAAAGKPIPCEGAPLPDLPAWERDDASFVPCEVCMDGAVLEGPEGEAKKTGCNVCGGTRQVDESVCADGVCEDCVDGRCPSCNGTGLVGHRQPTGWVDLLTWQSRRIELFCTPDGNVGQVSIADGLELEGAPRDPMGGWRLTAQQEWQSVGFQPERLLWRDVHVLLTDLGDVDVVRPHALSRLAEMRAFLPALRYALQLFGMKSQKAKILMTRTETFPVSAALLADQARGEIISVAVEDAERGELALKFALLDLARAVLALGSKDKEQEKVVTHTGGLACYWAALAVPFATLLGALTRPETNLDTLGWTFTTTTRRAAITALAEAARGLGRGAVVLKGHALGELKLYQTLDAARKEQR